MPKRSTQVMVLGGSGMLGSMLVDYLSRQNEFEVHATVRTEDLIGQCSTRVPEVQWHLYEVDPANSSGMMDTFRSMDWVINAIGITKPLIHDDKAIEVERAIRINSYLPHSISGAASDSGARVLQIATDCVFSGESGDYLETDPHDAMDVYGKSKSLGEVPAAHMHNLRVSIVGPEPKEHKFLLEWFLGQPQGAEINGYANHYWNGVTTLHFAKICQAIISHEMKVPRIQHLLPSGRVSKHELLLSFAENFDRLDVTIKPTDAETVIDRTLGTANKETNQELWSAAGYSNPPTVPEMVEELAAFDYRMEIM